MAAYHCPVLAEKKLVFRANGLYGQLTDGPTDNAGYKVVCRLLKIVALHNEKQNRCCCEIVGPLRTQDIVFVLFLSLRENLAHHSLSMAPRIA